MSPITILFYFVVAISQAQRLIDLKSLNGNNANNSIFNGTTAIYATATMDKADLLKNIWIDSSESGLISIYDLTQQRSGIDSDLMVPLVARGVTTVTTSLSQEQVNLLTGMIYCTSEAQATNKLHRVYDVSRIQQVRVDPGNFGNYTLVFLNSRTFYTSHMHSTSFSNWNQGPGSSVRIYQNIPTDAPEVSRTEIFSNPMVINETPTFFPTVNDFAITLPVFYMRVSGTDSFLFKTTPDYYDVNLTQTKAFTSTGFFMKSVSEVERFIRIQLSRDPDYNVTSGANSIAEIPQKSSVTVRILTGSDSVNTTFTRSDKIVGWTTSFIGNALDIYSQNTNGGQYFLQYFTIQQTESPSTGSTGAYSNSTTSKLAVSTTSSSIQTSTKSTGKLNFYIPIVISILGASIVFYG